MSGFGLNDRCAIIGVRGSTLTIGDEPESQSLTNNCSLAAQFTLSRIQEPRRVAGNHLLVARIGADLAFLRFLL